MKLKYVIRIVKFYCATLVTTFLKKKSSGVIAAVFPNNNNNNNNVWHIHSYAIKN
jgi:hypothetical protein